MKIAKQHRSQRALVSTGLLGLLLASVVACGDFTAPRGEIVIEPGAQDQVAEALRIKPSKLNRFRPSAALAKKTEGKVARPGVGSASSQADNDDGSDTGDPSDVSDETVTTLEDCPTTSTTEEIPCDVLADALDPMNTGSATPGPDCTCTSVSWCEEDGDGVCMCYTMVGDCG